MKLISASNRMGHFSESLADLHAAQEAFARAKRSKEQEQRYLNSEIKYRTWADGEKRRNKEREARRVSIHSHTTEIY